MTIFYSTKKRHAIVLDPGGDVPVEVGKGQFKYKRMEEIKAVFDDHEFDSEKFVKNNKATLSAREWNLKKVDDTMRDATRFELDFHEVKPPTAQEKLTAAEALMSQARELFKEAEKLKPGSGHFSEKMVKKAPIDFKNKKKTYVKPVYKCGECGQESKNETGLKNHMRMVHIKEEEELASTVL